ncbi:MAG: DoxX family protein [Deltaproteobacteria bacterium]|nr:DoxX family protein [Deltaproteobacteria bacterium]
MVENAAENRTENSKRFRSVSILSAIVALVFLGAGSGKLIGAGQMVETFEHFGFDTDFMRFTGAASWSADADQNRRRLT